MGLWDSVLDWFQKEEYDYDEKKVKEASDKLMEELKKRELAAEAERRKEMDKLVNESLPVLPKTEIKELPKYDEEQIKKEAESIVLPDYEKEKKKTEGQYSEKINTKNELLNENELAEQEKSRAAEGETGAKKEEFKNKAIKNGIIKSSIVPSMNDALDEAYEEELGRIAEKYDAKNAKLIKEIEQLNLEKEEKAGSIDEKYKAELDKRIDALNSEYEKNKAAVEKENKAAELALTKAKAEREKLRSELMNKYNNEYEELLKNEKIYGITDEERKKEYGDRLKLAIEFYNQFPPKLAKQLAYANNELPRLLGAYNRQFREYLNGLE